jgi:hypothetical protein
MTGGVFEGGIFLQVEFGLVARATKSAQSLIIRLRYSYAELRIYRNFEGIKDDTEK